MEWSDIRIFLQVARSGRMSDASRLLDMDHSTISRRIARLEESTGVALFDRAARRLRLTAEGAKLLSAAEGLEAIIIRDVMSLADRDRRVGGKVRIGTSESFGSHYLAGRLPDILAHHPELEVELIALQRSHSLGKREADIVIGVERPTRGDIRFRKLCAACMRIYSKTDFFEGRPVPTRLEDLRPELWCGFVAELLVSDELNVSVEEVDIGARYRTTSETAQLAAVRSGKALALLPAFMADGYADLMPILPGLTRIELSFWMSVHNDLANSPRVRAVMDAIETAVAADRSLFLPEAR